MGKVLIDESTLTAIANAIREKTGTTVIYKPSQMAAAIASITTGSTGLPGFQYFSDSASLAKMSNPQMEHLSFDVSNCTQVKITFSFNPTASPTTVDDVDVSLYKDVTMVEQTNDWAMSDSSGFHTICSNLARKVTDVSVTLDVTDWTTATLLVYWYHQNDVGSKLKISSIELI